MNSNVTPLLMLALAVGIFFTYLSPQYAVVGELQAKQAEYSDAIQRAKEIQSLQEDLEASYSKFSENDLERLNTLLPDKIDTVKLAFDIDGIAAKYGISIRNIKTDRPLDSIQALDENASLITYGTQKISFSFVAPYENFIAFLREMEQSLRILDLKNLTFKPAAGDTIEYSVTFATYWLK